MLHRFAPLRVRLPMTVALLLAVCTGAVITIAYRAVRSSVTQTTGVRLRGAGERIASLLETSVRRAQADAQRFAALPSVAAWLRGGTPGDALIHLDSLRRAGTPAAAVVLARQDGTRITVGDSASVNLAAAAPNGVGPFFARRDTAGYTIAAPLLSGRDTVGRLVTVRMFSGTGNPAEVLGGLVGKDASFRIGNADGGLWTDFVKRSPAPLDARTVRAALGRNDAVIADTISAVLPIAGTPWILWVGQPSAIAEEPATRLIRRLAVIAIVAIVLGAAIAWWAILALTAPLVELATASDALARGDYDRRIPHATDEHEIGRAAIAFNSMAGSIAENHHELERQVRERTSELERAMSELRAAQDENVRKERLAVLGQLAGGVGHELRNPLGVMTNALYVLETIQSNPDPMVRDYFGILKGQIALSEKIVSDLLDFARTRPPSRAPVGIESIARHQVDRLGPTSVPIEWDIPNSLPMVNVDGIQIGQVVFNLVTNAVQAMHGRDGCIRIRAFRDDDAGAVLQVIDCGPGIAADAASHVFEPLFTTKTKGLGLGLSVSRMLAENNGGRLWFETRVGAGTTFSLAMPVAAHE